MYQLFIIQTQQHVIIPIKSQKWSTARVLHIQGMLVEELHIIVVQASDMQMVDILIVCIQMPAKFCKPNVLFTIHLCIFNFHKLFYVFVLKKAECNRMLGH